MHVKIKDFTFSMQSDSIVNLNEFKIMRMIGKGQFGKVFLIENKETRRSYAAKINKLKLSYKREYRAFMNEIEAYLNARHPTVLCFLGYNCSDFNDQPYPTIITDYMPNGSLQDKFDREKEYGFAAGFTDTIKYINLLGIAFGMKFLHSHGIVHRDLKPANILLDEHLYPRICDFGLSKKTEEQITKILMDSTVGTPLYMAPEIMTSENYTYKVDVYSFAIIAYQLITKKRPPIDMSFVEGEACKSFLNRCRSKNPTERPNFDEIVEEITKGSFIQSFGRVEIKEVYEYIRSFNSSESFYLYGLILHQSISRNGKKESIRFYKMGADKGNPDSIYKYAQLLHKGDGVPVNKQEAYRYYRMAAEKGHSKAMNECGLMLWKGDGILINKDKAKTFFRMAIEKGNTDSMSNYGVMLQNGDGVEMNKEKALKLFKTATDEGNADGMYNYARVLYQGDDVNKKLASQYFKLSAEKGNAEAMYKYSRMLKQGECFTANLTEACRFCKMAADKGNVEAMNNYGFMLDKGEGTPIDKKQASYYYKMAADHGNISAMNNYGLMLYKGDGIPFNKEEACRYYKMAADKGNANAMNNYGFMLQKGDGVQISREKACYYYKMSAEKGNVNAMYNYGFMLYNGLGTKENKEEAIIYYKKAAYKGNRDAILVLRELNYI